MGIDLEAPDHTTLSRRTQHLDVELAGVASSRPIHLIVDSTGLTIAGEGEKDSGYHQQARVENTFFREMWPMRPQRVSRSLAIGFELVIRNHSEGRP